MSQIDPAKLAAANKFCRTELEREAKEAGHPINYAIVQQRCLACLMMIEQTFRDAGIDPDSAKMLAVKTLITIREDTIGGAEVEADDNDYAISLEKTILDLEPNFQELIKKERYERHKDAAEALGGSGASFQSSVPQMDPDVQPECLVDQPITQEWVSPGHLQRMGLGGDLGE